MSESVNHPQHYQKEGRKECIKEMEERFGTYQTCIFALCSAYKYIYRAGEKEGNTKKQDLKKAYWYIKYVEDTSVDMFYGLERAYIKTMTEIIREEYNNVES